MDLLLDSNVLLGVLEEDLSKRLQEALANPEHKLIASVASLWEIAIKVRLGKLHIRTPLERLPSAVEKAGMTLLTIDAAHVLALVQPMPDTRDPFDRLLLAQCAVENLKLVTLDRVLGTHPLAWAW